MTRAFKQWYTQFIFKLFNGDAQGWLTDKTRGSLETLEDVIDFYNNGGRDKETDPLSGFQSGGIRPLNLTDAEKQDLVAFMKALTSPVLDQFTKLRSLP